MNRELVATSANLAPGKSGTVKKWLGFALIKQNHAVDD